MTKDRTRLGAEEGKEGWGQEKEEGPSHPLLEFRLLLQGHGVSLSNDRNDVHNFAEVLHELQIEGSQAGAQRRRDVRATLPSPTPPWPPCQGHPWDRRDWAGNLAEAKGLLLLLHDSLPESHCLRNRLQPSAPQGRDYGLPFASNPAPPAALLKQLLQDSIPAMGIFFSWE